MLKYSRFFRTLLLATMEKIHHTDSQNHTKSFEVQLIACGERPHPHPHLVALELLLVAG